MRRTLLLILIICNSLLLIGFGWLYGRVRERDRVVSRLQEQVAYLTEYLPFTTGEAFYDNGES